MLIAKWLQCLTKSLSSRATQNHERSRHSKPAWRNPETFPPGSARRNGLEFLINPGVRQIEGIGDGRHGLEADEVLAGRRVDDRHRIFGSIDHGNLPAAALNPEFRALVFAAHQIFENIIE